MSEPLASSLLPLLEEKRLELIEANEAGKLPAFAAIELIKEKWPDADLDDNARILVGQGCSLVLGESFVPLKRKMAR